MTSPPPQGAQPSFTRAPFSLGTFATLLRELDRIGKGHSGGTLQLKGKGHSLTHQQVLVLRNTAARELTQAASRVRISAETALESYQYQQHTNREHWVVSPVVHLFGRVQDPGPALDARVTEVRQATDAVRARLAASHLSGALTHLLRAERASEAARDLWRWYQEGIINGSDTAVTALEFTRNASFITLGVLATIGTGGLGFTATTTAFSIEMGATTALTTVNTLTVAAPIVAQLAQAGVRTALGDRVDWVRVGVDAAVDVITARVGGNLSQELFQRLGGNPAVQRRGANLFSRIVSSVVVFEGTTVFREVVDAMYRSLRGQPMSRNCWIRRACSSPS